MMPNCLVFILDSSDCCNPDWTKIKVFNTLWIDDIKSAHQFTISMAGEYEVINGWMQWEQSSPLYASQVVRVLTTQAILTVVLVKVHKAKAGLNIPDYSVEVDS